MTSRRPRYWNSSWLITYVYITGCSCCGTKYNTLPTLNMLQSSEYTCIIIIITSCSCCLLLVCGTKYSTCTYTEYTSKFIIHYSVCVPHSWFTESMDWNPLNRSLTSSPSTTFTSRAEYSGSTGHHLSSSEQLSSSYRRSVEKSVCLLLRYQ